MNNNKSAKNPIPPGYKYTQGKEQTPTPSPLQHSKFHINIKHPTLAPTRLPSRIKIFSF